MSSGPPRRTIDVARAYLPGSLLARVVGVAAVTGEAAQVRIGRLSGAHELNHGQGCPCHFGITAGMSADYDIIVIGCGTMGAATLAALAGGPSRVLGLDRAAPPHTLGEHHGVVRMFRMSYYEHPAYVPWLRYSKDAWLAMGRGQASELLELTGALYLGTPDSELISGSLRSAREHGLAA